MKNLRRSWRGKGAFLALSVMLLGAGPSAVAQQLRSLRSEEHTSELQSQSNLVCRLLLEKKKQNAASRTPSQHTQHPPDPHRSPLPSPHVATRHAHPPHAPPPRHRHRVPVGTTTEPTGT